MESSYCCPICGSAMRETKSAYICAQCGFEAENYSGDVDIDQEDSAEQGHEADVLRSRQEVYQHTEPEHWPFGY